MIENLPLYLPVVFVLTTILTLWLFVWALKSCYIVEPKRNLAAIILGLLLWLVVQAVMALIHLYSTDINSIPPKIVLTGILPPILIIALLFVTKRGKQFIDSLPLNRITWLHTIRLPVEIILVWLYLYKTIPELMTFEGRNFDIIAGLTAPVIAYYGVSRKKISRGAILTWNFICLGLLLSVVVNAFFSAPSPLQKFAFDQPNIAILYFPFIWLPTFIVPVVLFGHLVSIRQLLKKQR